MGSEKAHRDWRFLRKQHRRPQLDEIEKAFLESVASYRTTRLTDFNFDPQAAYKYLTTKEGLFSPDEMYWLSKCQNVPPKVLVKAAASMRKAGDHYDIAAAGVALLRQARPDILTGEPEIYDILKLKDWCLAQYAVLRPTRDYAKKRRRKKEKKKEGEGIPPSPLLPKHRPRWANDAS